MTSVGRCRTIGNGICAASCMLRWSNDLLETGHAAFATLCIESWWCICGRFHCISSKLLEIDLFLSTCPTRLVPNTSYFARQSLVVVTRGWQRKATEGPKSGWGCEPPCLSPSVSSLRLSVCLCPSVSLSVCLFISTPVALSVSLFLSRSLFLYPSLPPSPAQFDELSFCLSLFVNLSVSVPSCLSLYLTQSRSRSLSVSLSLSHYLFRSPSSFIGFCLHLPWYLSISPNRCVSLFLFPLHDLSARLSACLYVNLSI